MIVGDGVEGAAKTDANRPHDNTAATAISAPIKPYLIAVTPLWSLIFEKIFF
jgi:hypothetical protein